VTFATMSTRIALQWVSSKVHLNWHSVFDGAQVWKRRPEYNSGHPRGNTFLKQSPAFQQFLPQGLTKTE